MTWLGDKTHVFLTCVACCISDPDSRQFGLSPTKKGVGTRYSSATYILTTRWASSTTRSTAPTTPCRPPSTARSLVTIWLYISIYVEKEGRKCFILTTHSTHFIYGYMASDIWLRTILIVRKETHCCPHIGYSFWLTARVLLYAPSHRQDSTYDSVCYTSHGALAGMRNSSMGPPHEGSIRRPIAPWANALTTELHLAPSHKTIMYSPWRINPMTHRTICRKSTAIMFFIHVCVSVIQWLCSKNTQTGRFKDVFCRWLGAFMGTGEPAVASNIIPQTHRIQRWDFTRCQIPDITQGQFVGFLVIFIFFHYYYLLYIIYFFMIFLF